MLVPPTLPFGSIPAEADAPVPMVAVADAPVPPALGNDNVGADV